MYQERRFTMWIRRISVLLALAAVVWCVWPEPEPIDRTLAG